jgi:hypothetical protein
MARALISRHSVRADAALLLSCSAWRHDDFATGDEADAPLMLDRRAVQSLRWVTPWVVKALNIADFYELDASFTAIRPFVNARRHQKCECSITVRRRTEWVRAKVRDLCRGSDCPLP